MRKLLSCLLALLLTAMPALAQDDVWMYAASVGKADAILLHVNGRTCLVDTGYMTSRGRILSAMKRMNVTALDAVIVTHTDSDHVGGLEWLAKSDIPVGVWYASELFSGKEEKHPAIKAAKIRGQEVVWLRKGDSVPLGGAALDILAPSEKSDNENDNSLVMLLTTDQGRVLLCGDMEFAEEAALLNSGADLKCDVLKVANHADDDTMSETFLRAAQPKLAVISTDSYEKPSTPDPRILAMLEAAGAKIAVTQDCSGGILARLTGGEPTYEYVNLPANDGAVVIESAISGEDIITLRNTGGEAVSVEDWYLYSDRGGEWFVFPKGTTIAPGARLTVGSNSSKIQTDLRWDDKKVVHKSKEDVFTLYDDCGMIASIQVSQ